LCCCVIVLLCCCVVVLLCCCVVVLLCCCVVVLLCYCVVVLLCCCVVIVLSFCRVVMLLFCRVVMLSWCYVVLLLCCRTHIPDLPTYLVFYMKTTRGSSIYSTYLIYPDLFTLHANNANNVDTLQIFLYSWQVDLKCHICFLAGRCWRTKKRLKILRSIFIPTHHFIFFFSFLLFQRIALENAVGESLGCQFCPFLANNSVRYYITVTNNLLCACKQN
jgi:hypothetical protein